MVKQPPSTMYVQLSEIAQILKKLNQDPKHVFNVRIMRKNFYYEFYIYSRMALAISRAAVGQEQKWLRDNKIIEQELVAKAKSEFHARGLTYQTTTEDASCWYFLRPNEEIARILATVAVRKAISSCPEPLRSHLDRDKLQCQLERVLTDNLGNPGG